MRLIRCGLKDNHALRSTVNNDKFHSALDDFNEEILHENINHGGRHKMHRLAKSRLLPFEGAERNRINLFRILDHAILAINL